MAALCLTAALSAGAGGGPPRQSPSYRAAKARRHFISITVDTRYIQPYGFAKHPLEELLGQPVDEVHLESFQYRTRDQQTLVNVLEYGKRGTGVGVTVYPFGSSVGATLAVRGSIESLPDLRVAFTGPAPAPVYELTGGRAFDVGAGLEMSDRSAGWGLGSHAFLLGGIGRAQTDQMDGHRFFGEGGGGLMFGPFGVDLSVKYVVTRFDLPVSHAIHMVPINVRGTLTF